MITINTGHYHEFADSIRRIRTEVFVHEQGVPEELEVDGLDEHCIHALATDGSNPIGTGRIQSDGHIGRVAVVASHRGTGVGTRIVAALIESARRHGHRRVWLSSQAHAADFYRRLGFEAFGESYEEAGIPHIRMELHLSPTVD